MRRGHPGIGGWRNDNPRHFRPRMGGIPPFRPPRNFPQLGPTRFLLPSPRLHRGPPPLVCLPGQDGRPPEHHDRNKYKHQHRPQERGHEHHQRHNYPSVQGIRHPDHSNVYQDRQKYYEEIDSEMCRINSMGDIDHRQPFNVSHNSESFDQHQSQSWRKNIRKYSVDKRSHSNKQYAHNDHDGRNIDPMLPHSSNYHNRNITVVDTSNTFNYPENTVTVDKNQSINHSDPHHSLEQPPLEKIHGANTNEMQTNTSDINQNNQQQNQEKTVKYKRVPRQKHKTKSNCDKIKNNIIHQLFNVDKGKMRKLMDNPSSSAKFEYAINSLITESQNSLNSHLRSVAEKSLYSSNSDIYNDSNKIYEDTFMKQMQCILDPQDTVLLEDIKPIVLAELTKVLQLDDIEQVIETAENQTAYGVDKQSNNDQYPNQLYTYQDYPQYYPEGDHDSYYEQNNSSQTDSEAAENSDIKNISVINNQFNYSLQDEVVQPLFERRSVRKSSDLSQDTKPIVESLRHSRRSVDTKTCEDKFDRSKTPVPQKSATPLPQRSNTPLPLFNTNAENLSEDEDPFAELDNQYHVAVDHSFIDTDFPQQSNDTDIYKSPKIKNEIIEKLHTPDKIKTDIDNQLQNIAKSPIKLFSSLTNNKSDEQTSTEVQVKNEKRTRCADSPKKPLSKVLDSTKVNQEQNSKSKDVEKETDKSESFSNIEKSSIPSYARKRSIDQRPSHRKEKRKKSESSSSETSKQILNKNIIINVNDCATKDKCDAPKSIFNLFFSKEENSKEGSKDKKLDSTDAVYSEKYVKRKEIPKKSSQNESDSRKNSNSSNHSILNLKEKNSNNKNSETITKVDTKTKLKTIDMFSEHPRKVNVHLAHRNTTAAANTTNNKNIQVNKPKQKVTHIAKRNKINLPTKVGKQMQSKLIQTIETKCSTSRYSQTDIKNTAIKAIQTDPVCFAKSGSKSTDTFERMKEIDYEIQLLLQEKFKLYNSLESKNPCQSNMQSFGMTVLDVNPVKEEKGDDAKDTLSGDAIIEDFTNIPVEELEKIALETVNNEIDETSKIEKPKRRQNVRSQRERKTSQSSITSVNARKSNRKAKTPNISLIEQIITDDRPLEDIISLEDFETSPVKTRNRQKSQQVPKRVVKKSVKPKPVKPIDLTMLNIKECSVVLIKEDLSKYMQKKVEELPVIEESTAELEEDNIVVETVLNDLSLDMLDVSEDIVIGDICEVKSTNDKDECECIEVPITEEIILDNSQSSMEDVATSDLEQIGNECRMFDYSADESLRRDSITVSGHADAVLAIECIDNNFIAACLDGNVYYFRNDGQLINTLRGSNLAVTCLTIVKEKYGTTVYTGSLDSRIRYYDLETGLEKGPECNVLSPIQTMDRAWDTVFVGTRTGFVLQFECKNNMLIPVSTVKFSEQSILALRAMKEGPRKVLLVAARSENVTIRDAQSGLLLRTLTGPKMTVYTLLYEDGKVYCGTSSHQIHVFDYSSGGHVGTHEGGKGAVCLRATGGLIFSGCYDGCVYVYRDGESRPLAQLRGPGLMLLSLAVVGNKIIAGYKDRSLYIWKIPQTIMQEIIL